LGVKWSLGFPVYGGGVGPWEGAIRVGNISFWKFFLLFLLGKKLLVSFSKKFFHHEGLGRFEILHFFKFFEVGANKLL